jgi:hypothetical protein
VSTVLIHHTPHHACLTAL